MGHGSWQASDWNNYSKQHVAGKTQAQIFTSHSINAEFDPAKIAFRESVKSADNPRPTPIILASDVTGSMGMIAHRLMEDGLNKVAQEIYDHNPVTNPHIAVMAVGDAYSDKAPLQVTQFEASIVLADQVRKLWLEGNGGGNGGESYTLAHLFAAMKTKLDSEADGRKGYLFTIGDEPVHQTITKEHASRFLDIQLEADMSSADAVALASRKFHCFHLVLRNEGYCRYGFSEVMESWNKVLPGNTIVVEDVKALGDVVGGIIRRIEGEDVSSILSGRDNSTALVVANAIKNLAVSRQSKGAGGIVALAD